MKLPRNKTITFFESYGSINAKSLFTHYFNTVPSYISIDNIDSGAMYHHIIAPHREKIIHEIVDEVYSATENKKRPCRNICMFSTGEMLYVSYGSIEYYYKRENLFSAKCLMKKALKFKESPSKNSVSLLVTDEGRLTFRPFKITKPEINIAKHYNDDIIEFQKKTMKTLNKVKEKGLALLYGKPGTGKTTYIRWLISKISKDVLYVPSGLTDALSNPDFLNLLADNKGAVLVIEDAEKALIARELGQNDAVSTLLNLSDGILSDVMKMQVICTFNTDINNIDKALLRPGRLIGKYEFKELCVPKAQALCNMLGYNRTITAPITLAEAFSDEHQESVSFSNRNNVGFKTNAALVA